MTSQPPGQREKPDDTERRAGSRHRMAVVITCLAAIAVLAVGVALSLTSVVGGNDEQIADDVPPAGSTHNGDGAAPGAKPTRSGPSEGADSAPGKVLELEDHPLLQDRQVGLPNLACDLPEWRSDEESARQFFRAATRCLDAAWAPVLRAHDVPFTPPRLYFPSGSRFASECGTITVGIETAAYYCEGELFLPYRGLQTEQYQDNAGVYLALIAHEYGHHVQELAGIMDAAWQQIYQAGEHTPEGREMSRRKELQAQCFSGMFLGAHVDRGGSVTREMFDAAWQDQETRGDDTSGGSGHGSNENYAHWWRVGALDNRITDCNTFTAPPDAVS